METTQSTLASALMLDKDASLSVAAEKQMTLIQMLHETQRKIKHLNQRMLIVGDEVLGNEVIKEDIQKIGKEHEKSTQMFYFLKVTANGIGWK